MYGKDEDSIVFIPKFVYYVTNYTASLVKILPKSSRYRV
jgi:hypothetical protein